MSGTKRIPQHKNENMNQTFNTNQDLSTNEDYNGSTFVDGGWGWVIVMSSFFLCVINNGISNSTGIFYVEIVERFHGGSAEVAWIMSLMRFLYLLIGPVASAMMTCFGARVTIIVGSSLMAVGFLISATASDIYHLYFSMGVLTGAGLGITFQAAVVMVSYYFLKRRGLANGIATCGSGVGLTLFPPMINKLLECFGFRGACVLIAGICLQGVVCGALVLPSELALKIKQKREEKRQLKASCGYTDSSGNSSQSSDAAASDRSPDSIKSEESLLFTTTSKIENKDLAATMVINSQENFIYSSQQEKKTLQSRSLTFIEHFKLMIKAAINIKLFKNSSFIVFTLSMTLFNYGLPTTYVFIPGRAKSLGMSSQQGSLLISAVGITSIIARFICGLLADMKWASGRRLYMYAAGMLIGGAGTIANFGPTFLHQMLSAILFGLCIGAFASLLCLTMADLFGIKELAKTYGMMNSIAAFASLAGPALSGWIFDTTGRYDIVFAWSGSSLLLTGMVLFIIPCINHQQELRNQKYINNKKLEA